MALQPGRFCFAFICKFSNQIAYPLHVEALPRLLSYELSQLGTLNSCVNSAGCQFEDGSREYLQGQFLLSFIAPGSGSELNIFVWSELLWIWMHGWASRILNAVAHGTFYIHNWTKSVVHCFFLLLGLPCHVFRSSYKVWFTHFAVFQSAGPACPFGNGDSSMNQVSGVSSVRSGGKVMLQFVSPMLEIETVLNESWLTLHTVKALHLDIWVSRNGAFEFEQKHLASLSTSTNIQILCVSYIFQELLKNTEEEEFLGFLQKRISLYHEKIFRENHSHYRLSIETPYCKISPQYPVKWPHDQTMVMYAIKTLHQIS
ncbi:hypothetical protein H5410_017703 [Solanum commersonii]|uniref:Uncharacterized protein n=1 Tax=Solanum commersonii TaxID=4109 RepID=A0A9J6A173_SOLCO|nr:hypothetical protein H5410_017703 [Solanum commersonii]